MADVQQLVRAERRRKRRFSTPGLAALQGERRVQILDISLTGLGFATRHSLRPHERLKLRICAQTGHFTITGVLSWCRFEGTFRNAAGEAEPRYRAGLRFDPLHPRDAQHLLDLLDRLESSTPCSGASPPRPRPSSTPPTSPPTTD